jgi:hypothetical protein
MPSSCPHNEGLQSYYIYSHTSLDYTSQVSYVTGQSYNGYLGTGIYNIGCIYSVSKTITQSLSLKTH